MLYKHRNKQLLIGIYTPKKKKNRINLSVNDEPLSLELGFNVDYDSGKIEKKKTNPDITWTKTESNRLRRPLTRSHKIVDISFASNIRTMGSGDGVFYW